MKIAIKVNTEWDIENVIPFFEKHFPNCNHSWETKAVTIEDIFWLRADNRLFWDDDDFFKTPSDYTILQGVPQDMELPSSKPTKTREQELEEMLAEKDKEIKVTESMRKDLLVDIAELKSKIENKDKEIERLKSENQKLNKVELFRYEHGFEACSIVYLINGEIHLYSIPMYGGEEKEEYIDFIDLEDLIEKIKKFT